MEWNLLKSVRFLWVTIHITFSDGYLGSRNDEERSEMRYVMRIAEFSESSKFWTHIALSGYSWKYVCLSACSSQSPFVVVQTKYSLLSVFYLVLFFRKEGSINRLVLECPSASHYVAWRERDTKYLQISANKSLLLLRQYSFSNIYDQRRYKRVLFLL